MSKQQATDAVAGEDIDEPAVTGAAAEIPAEEADTRTADAPPASDVAAPEAGAEYEQLLKERDAALEEAAELREKLLRSLADVDNLRKRHQREMEGAHKYALERFAGELLAVRDSLELGLAASEDAAADVASLREGTELTLKMLTTVLEKFDIREIAPQGEKFDPEFHQAMATQPSADLEPGHVATVYQKGYLLNDRLLRPALVIVSAAPSGDAGT